MLATTWQRVTLVCLISMDFGGDFSSAGTDQTECQTKIFVINVIIYWYCHGESHLKQNETSMFLNLQVIFLRNRNVTNGSQPATSLSFPHQFLHGSAEGLQHLGAGSCQIGDHHHLAAAVTPSASACLCHFNIQRRVCHQQAFELNFV